MTVSAPGLMDSVPGPVTGAAAGSAAQVSGLPPATASNRPAWVKVPLAAVKVKRTVSVFCCGPVPVKVTRWRA